MSRLFSGTPLDRPPNCPRCGKPPTACRCLALPPKKKMSHTPHTLDSGLTLTPQNSTPPEDQLATIRLERRKGGRIATTISGLDHPANDLHQLLSELQKLLSAGGSIKKQTIELQGEHAQKVNDFLISKNIKSKFSKY